MAPQLGSSRVGMLPQDLWIPEALPFSFAFALSEMRTGTYLRRGHKLSSAFDSLWLEMEPDKNTAGMRHLGWRH